MHFSILVILKKGENLEEVMNPFYDSLEVPEHDEVCWCVSSEAKRDVAKKLSFEVEVRDAHAALPEAERTNAKWRQQVAEFKAKEKAALQAHPKYGKPDKKCSECKGTGIYKSTNNPEGHWDYYTEGGRWDGAFTTKKGKVVNRLKIKDLSIEQMELTQHNNLVAAWEEIQEKLKDPKQAGILGFTHGYQGEKTLEEYLMKNKSGEVLSGYAFLSDGKWLAHEKYNKANGSFEEVEGWHDKLLEAIKKADPNDELMMLDCHN